MKLEDLGVALLEEHPIAFHPILARIGGGATEGLFLSQLLYWRGKERDAEGWLYKTQTEWTEETCLNRHEQDRARTAWKALGVLEEKKEGLPCRLFYRINLERLTALLLEDAAKQQEEQANKIANPGKLESQPCQAYNTETTIPETTSLQDAKHPVSQAPKSEKPKSNRVTSDPRRKLPSIQCAKAVNDGRWPPKALWDDIVRILGPTPDGPKLVQCRKEWIARGYNKNGWNWLLQWYTSGVPPRANAGGRLAGIAERNKRVLEDFLQGESENGEQRRSGANARDVQDELAGQGDGPGDAQHVRASLGRRT